MVHGVGVGLREWLGHVVFNPELFPNIDQTGARKNAALGTKMRGGCERTAATAPVPWLGELWAAATGRLLWVVVGMGACRCNRMYPRQCTGVALRERHERYLPRRGLSTAFHTSEDHVRV